MTKRPLDAARREPDRSARRRHRHGQPPPAARPPRRAERHHVFPIWLRTPASKPCWKSRSAVDTRSACRRRVRRRRATYYGVTHPSQPNYIAATAGTTRVFRTTTTSPSTCRTSSTSSKPSQVLEGLHGELCALCDEVRLTPAATSLRAQAQPLHLVRGRPDAPSTGGEAVDFASSRTTVRVEARADTRGPPPPVQRHARKGSRRLAQARRALVNGAVVRGMRHLPRTPPRRSRRPMRGSRKLQLIFITWD